MKKIDKFKQDFKILDDTVVQYAGSEIYKIDAAKYNGDGKAKLVLLTAINPTKYGEGKTTCAIGLADALTKLGNKTIIALREPSMGPIFGSKGAATGGGECTLEPSEQINLHFTGDLHAISSANNLISAVIDSHLYWGNELNINLATISWNRCLDINDRGLRNVKIKIKKDVYRDESFVITAASKMMTILSLAASESDLRKRLNNTIFAFDNLGKPLYLSQLDVVGSVMALLAGALKPNLVFSKHETPALLHCGPFANIATGTNSAIATDLGLQLADFVVTESGFSSELGFQKYADVVSYQHGFEPDCVVLVVTVRALKEKGDYNDGFVNLEKHIGNVDRITSKLVVAINKFTDDSEEDLNKLIAYLELRKIRYAMNDSFTKGPDGALDFAKVVKETCEEKGAFSTFVNSVNGIENKIRIIANNYYYLDTINFSEDAKAKILHIKELNQDYYNYWPVVLAKSPITIDGNDAHDPNYEMTITDIELNSGAKFILALTNKVLMMPGLPKDGNYKAIDLQDDKIINIK